MFDSSWPGWTLLQSGISASAGLGGVLIGSWMTAQNQKNDRKNALVREKLQAFYSPMLGMWSDIRAKNATQEEIKRLSVEAYEQAKREGKEIMDLMPLREAASLGMYKYDGEQWRSYILPLYEKMLNYFTDHMWLAESSTIEHYGSLVRYIENWKRMLSFEMVNEVAFEVETSEDQMEPLRADLQKQFNRLREILNR